MRAFVKLRHYVLSKSDTNEQIAELRKLLMVYIENNDYKLSKHKTFVAEVIGEKSSILDVRVETESGDEINIYGKTITMNTF